MDEDTKPMWQEQWQVAGTAAEVYQTYLVPAIFGPWAPVVVGAAALQPGEHVLDVACGTGVVAREAAPRVGGQGTVIGLDLNPAMLAVARSLPAVSGAPILWREGSAVDMEFPDAAFDVVFCQAGLQYFPDRPAALREMHRVLAPGGRLVVLVWQSIAQSPGFDLLAKALDRHLGAPASAVMRAPFVLGDPDEVWTLIAGAGFRDVDVRGITGTLRFPSADLFLGYQVAGSPLAGPVSDAGEEARAALFKDANAALRPYVDPDGLSFPIGAVLAVAK